MAIKERLLKQLNIVRDGLNAMPPFHSRDLNAMRNSLVQARDLCFQGLSENRFAEYKDTYDGLLLAIDQLAANASDQKEIISLCSELLQYTLAQTQKETQFKTEIFFLPYKASMWDSLESVWKAADEDKEHCIAYVMPIPYADLTPEHTVAEWHCERELFPKDVPTVNWKDFDLQEIHPDVIYIHNPYDEYNRVTSVESRYYSSVLKDQTDKLVYIPYFVLEEIIPGNEAAEEAISGFILAPAVLNANEVIVQSEDMRQVYINVLIRNTNQKDRAYWEKRVLGLGSPKIEKVLTSKKEDFELPEAWAKIVKGKKVILYNTSLNAMLQNSDKVCEKLRYVFNVFNNRNDVAFWWRPHPLMKATIHSMRPEIEEEYCTLERQYIEEGWGVFDDTGDLHRAIAWSDAYYGDWSSVIPIYRETGKPAVIENFWEDKCLPSALFAGSCAWINETQLQICSWFSGCIFSINIVDGMVADCIFLPEPAGSDAFVAACPYGEFVFLIPHNAKDLWRFDKTTSEFKKLDIGLSPDEKDQGMKFRSATIRNGKLFLFGYRFPGIIIYDIASGNFRREEAYVHQLLERGIKISHTGMNMYCALYGNKAYLPLENLNYVLEFDTDTESCKLIEVGDTDDHFFALTVVGTTLILTDSNGEEISFDLENGDLKKQKNYLADQLVNRYRDIFAYKNKEIFVPETKPFIGCQENGKMRKIDFPVYLYKGQPVGTYCLYSFVHISDGALYLQSRTDGVVHIFNLETMEESRVEIQVNSFSDIRKKMIEKSLKCSQIFWEAYFVQIEDLIQSVICAETKSDVVYRGNIGSNIFRL